VSTVEVVIPWRPGCPHRTAALDHILNLYHQHGFAPVVAEHDDGPWCKAKAVTPAVGASSADLIIMADGDCWVPNLSEALSAAERYPWVVPHRMVHRLTPAATSGVYDRTVTFNNIAASDCEQPPYRGFAGGGIVIVPRSTYLDVPLDPRFEGWSGEDESWARALSTLAGEPWRGDAPLFHLWHPPQLRMNRRHGSTASEALTFNYRQAKGRPQRMRRIIEEGRETWPTLNFDSSRARSVNS
jgi:hypothetical protein